MSHNESYPSTNTITDYSNTTIYMLHIEIECLLVSQHLRHTTLIHYVPMFHFHQKTGVLLTYHIIVRGLDINMNKSRVLTNVTIDAATPTLLLANLTEGVTYTVSVAAGNRAGLGPYNSPATLRLDPITKRLDQSASHRFVLHFLKPIHQWHTYAMSMRRGYII